MNRWFFSDGAAPALAPAGKADPSRQLFAEHYRILRRPVEGGLWGEKNPKIVLAKKRCLPYYVDVNIETISFSIKFNT